jgi:proline iminopeptidase
MMRFLAMGLALGFGVGLGAEAQKPMPVVEPTGHAVTADVDVAYWVYGKPGAATPVFAVNGGPGLSHVYMVQNDVWQRVAEGRQVVLYDQRGTGLSKLKRADAPQTMEAQVADLDAVRAKLAEGHPEFEKIDLVGDSYGGLLVIAYAAAHPEHVAKLVVSDGLPGWKEIVHLFPQVFPDKLEAQAAAMKASGASEAEKEQQGLRDHFDMIFYSRTKLATYMANAKDLGFAPEVGAAVSKATGGLDYMDALPKFQFPALIITGRYDMNVAPLTAWKMYKAIPGAKFEVFEESGHLPSYEEPEKYVRVLEEFLR